MGRILRPRTQAGWDLLRRDLKKPRQSEIKVKPYYRDALSCLWLFEHGTTSLDILSGKAASHIDGSVGWRGTEVGHSLYHPSGNRWAKLNDSDTRYTLASATEFTLVFLVKPDAINGNNVLFNTNFGSLDDAVTMWLDNSGLNTGNVNCISIDFINSAARIETPTDSVAVGIWNPIVATFDLTNGEYAVCTHNSTETTDLTGTLPSSVPAGQDDIRLFDYAGLDRLGGHSALFGFGRKYIGVANARKLADSMMAELFQPANDGLFVYSSGGASQLDVDHVLSVSNISTLKYNWANNVSNTSTLNLNNYIPLSNSLNLNSNNIILDIYHISSIVLNTSIILENTLEILNIRGINISNLSNITSDKQLILETLLEIFGDSNTVVSFLQVINSTNNVPVDWAGQAILNADSIILLDYLTNIALDNEFVAYSLLNLNNDNSINISLSTNIDKDILYYIDNLSVLIEEKELNILSKESVNTNYILNIGNTLVSYVNKVLNTEWAGEAYLDIDANLPVDWVANAFRDNTVNTENVLLVHADSAYIAEINQGLDKQSSIPLANIADIYYNNEINAEFVSKLFIDKNLPISNTIIVFNNKDFRISQETLISFTAESDVEALTNILASSDVSIESLILSSIDPFSFPVSNNTIAEQIAQLNIDWSGVSAIFKHNVHSVYFLDPRGYVYTVKFNKDTWKVQDSKSNVWGVSRSNDVTWELPIENNTWTIH